ncbi:MAG: MaoC/PaaZ C-terminal domain-containing protein, partial [Myxococcota bacterium]
MSEEPRVGRELPPRTFEVSAELLDHHYGGLALDPPGDAAPVPSMLASVPDSWFSVASGYRNAFGNLWMRQEWELRQPLQLGQTYDASARIVDIYRKRDRTVVNTQMTLRDASGELAATARHHQSYLLEQQSGKVALRDPRQKEGSRRFQVPDGKPLEPLDREITLEMCGLFFHGQASYHTDKKVSQELGFEDVVVGGRMTMAYVGELLERHFGEPWWRSGTLDVKFTNIVWPGEHVTVRGVETT